MTSTELGEVEIAYLLEVMDLARAGESTQLKEQIDAGISVNLTSSTGDTLLILAAYHRHLETVEMLLEHGADHGRLNDRGQTALGCAVFRQDRALVETLLAAGAVPEFGAPSAVDVARFFGLTTMGELLAAMPTRPAGSD